MEKLINIGFPVCHTNKRGVRAAPRSRADLVKTLKPLLTLFVLNGPLVTKLPFAKLFRISRPTLNIEKSQGSACYIERHRVVQQKSNDPLGLGANGTQPFGEWVSAVVKAGGVLHYQDDLLFADALKGRLVVGLKKLIHRDLRVIEKPIGRSGLGSALTRLRQVGLRTLMEIARQSQKPSVQPLIVKLCLKKLLLRPILMLFRRAGLRLYLRDSATQDSRPWLRSLYTYTSFSLSGNVFSGSCRPRPQVVPHRANWRPNKKSPKKRLRSTKVSTNTGSKP